VKMSKTKTTKRKTIYDFFPQTPTTNSSEVDNAASCAKKVYKGNDSDCGASSETYQKFKLFNYDKKFLAQNVPTDGSCFFSALAHQLHRPLQDATAVRREIVEFIRENEQIVVSNN
jgi:hypothetical protein